MADYSLEKFWLMYELALKRVAREEARRDLALLHMVHLAAAPLVDGKAKSRFKSAEKALLQLIQS